MKKERIKKHIYDGVVNRIGVCLEKFLDDHVRDSGKNTMEKIEIFSDQFPAKNRAKIRNLMRKIRKARNDATHPRQGHNPANPVFNFDMFQKVRKNLIKLEDLLSEENVQAIGAGKVMLMSAEDQIYTMGNAGDFIKHGMLILLLDWLSETRGEIRYADPFGGNPWAKLENAEIRRRLNVSCMHDAWDGEGKYYGSGQIALHKGVNAWVSDKDMHRRSDLEASGLFLLDEGFPNYDNQNGYCILSPDIAGEFDLILIDPLGDFMRDKFGELENAVQAVKKNPNLFVMFFVLDMQSKNTPQESRGIYAKHKRFMEEREKMQEFACSLRCPKITDSGIKGESGYESEILMISQQLQNSDTDALRENLRNFAEHATSILPLKEREKVEFWGGKNE